MCSSTSSSLSVSPLAKVLQQTDVLLVPVEAGPFLTNYFCLMWEGVRRCVCTTPADTCPRGVKGPHLAFLAIASARQRATLVRLKPKRMREEELKRVTAILR